MGMNPVGGLLTSQLTCLMFSRWFNNGPQYEKKQVKWFSSLQFWVSARTNKSWNLKTFESEMGFMNRHDFFWSAVGAPMIVLTSLVLRFSLPGPSTLRSLLAACFLSSGHWTPAWHLLALCRWEETKIVSKLNNVVCEIVNVSVAKAQDREVRCLYFALPKLLRSWVARFVSEHSVKKLNQNNKRPIAAAPSSLLNNTN